MKSLIAYAFILNSYVVFSQTKIDSGALVSRQKADAVANKILGRQIKNKNYIIFSTADKNFIVEIEEFNGYSEFFIRGADTNHMKVLKKISFNKSDTLRRKMFKKNIYRLDYITFNSDFFKPSYEIASGNFTYFVLKDKQGNRYGEARLSVFVKPNPIDAQVYLYFIQRLLYFSRIFR